MGINMFKTKQTLLYNSTLTVVVKTQKDGKHATTAVIHILKLTSD